MKESKSPLVVTVNGTAVVVEDAQNYQEMVDRLQELEDLAAIREGIAQADARQTQPALEALAELRCKHGVSGRDYRAGASEGVSW